MKRKGLTKLLGKRKEVLLITEGAGTQSAGSVHNYFASKMAQFSQVMTFLSKKSEQSRQAIQFEKVRDKLTRLREEFLEKYHRLGRSSGGISSQTERVKEIYELLQRFEKAVLSEISGAGLQIAGFPEFSSFSNPEQA